MILRASEAGISFATRAMRLPRTATSRTSETLFLASITCPPFSNRSYLG